MSRLTKPILKAAIQSAVLGDGSGQSQIILTRPNDEAFRASLAGTVFPAGGMLSRRPGETGTTYSATNMMGDAPSRVLASAPSYDPKMVSIDPYLNPYFDYQIDKIAEGIATAHQEWQVRQRVRGVTLDKKRHHDNVISELETHLPFQTELAPEDQSDHEMRGDIIDTGLRDFQPGVAPRSGALAMLSQKSEVTSAKKGAAKPSPLLGGAASAGKTGPIFGDQGKYQNPKGGGLLQPAGGGIFASLFMFETWRNLASTMIEQMKRIVPPAAKLSPRGMELAGQLGSKLGKGE